MTTVYRNHIDGAWVPAASGETFEDRNPARPAEVIGEFARSGAADVDAAVAAARRAFPAWRRTPAPLRGEIVARAARLLAERKSELAAGVTHEMGKVLVDSGYDVQGAITSGEYMAGEGRRMFGDVVPSGLPDRFAMTMRDPVGVVGIVTPWNLPMLMPAWKLFPALVCGNTVIVKPAEDTPLAAVRLVADDRRGVVREDPGQRRQVAGPVGHGASELADGLLALGDAVQVAHGVTEPPCGPGEGCPCTIGRAAAPGKPGISESPGCRAASGAGCRARGGAPRRPGRAPSPSSPGPM